MKFIKVSNIKINVDESVDKAFDKAIKEAGINNKDIIEQKIVKYSIDARHKDSIKKLYTIGFKIKKYNKNRKNVVVLDREPEYEFVPTGTEKLKNRPVIVGFGPAGMFCGYMLAMYGYKPIIVERGSKVDQRLKKIEEFWSTGKLDENSNVQFGEGGAGTFSDGKLNTLVKDKTGRNRFVLETFVKFGADEDILYAHKPHIGTDVLIDVVSQMRQEIISLGGEFCFHTQVTDIDLNSKTLKVVHNTKDTSEDTISAGAAVFAIGHSARDTFEMLYKHQIPMRAKSFAVGVRIEHPQTLIDHSQYGRDRGNDLPAAAYKLTENLDNGRGVYTFCMCPGGYVVNASSEEHRLAVNGMSYHDRAGENANSAVIVTVTPDDFGSDHPLAGISFQRSLEEKAYQAGQGKVPVQRFGDFKEDQITTSYGMVHSCMKGASVFGDVRGIFPEEIAQSLEDGITAMDHKIHGFADNDALLSGVESRTSSPVRIERDENFVCASCDWIYPCGEGAGYAGGITSAAMDGMKVAEAIIQKYKS